MVDFPIKFAVSAKATSGISETWTAYEDGFDPINCSIPAEFQGPGGAYSPEGLFGVSIVSCIIGLYKVL